MAMTEKLPKHGLNFEYMRHTLKTTNSKAAIAVVNAFERALDSVLDKHPKRGDSWDDAFSLGTCINLAGAKLKRIEILLEGIGDGRVGQSECQEEMLEETGDALAYISFGLWKLERL